MVRAWIGEAKRAGSRLRDPCAFVVSRLASGETAPSAPSVAAEDDDSYEALKRRYVPDGWEDVVRH
jgi:hypothetical protein